MRLIDADALLADFKVRAIKARNWKENAILNGDEEVTIRADATIAFLTEVKLTIENAPTVDTTFKELVAYECGQKSVEERPTGHWVISKDGTYPICSVCITRGETQYNGVEPIPKCTNFCPNCGARMER